MKQMMLMDSKKKRHLEIRDCFLFIYLCQSYPRLPFLQMETEFFPSVAFMLCIFSRVILKEDPCIIAKYFILSTNCLRSDRYMLYLYNVSHLKKNKKFSSTSMATDLYIVDLIIKPYYCIFSIESFSILNVLEIKKVVVIQATD